MRHTVRVLLIVALASALVPAASAQYPWPVTPFDQSQEITGTFCEFRDTESADHFHNAADIPKPDGSPVYPVRNNQITDIVSTGSNAYVRVRGLCYLHIQPDPSLEVGDQVWTSQTVLGRIISGMGHVHFIDGYYDSEINPLRQDGGLTPYVDPYPPIIKYVRFYQNGTETQFSEGRVSGRVDIVVQVAEQNGPPSSALSRRNNGTYKIGYKILSADRDSVVYEPPNEGLRFRFDSKPNNSYVHNVFMKSLSSTSVQTYIVTNDIHSDYFWDTSLLDPGAYTVMVFTEDTRENTDTAYVAVDVSEEDIVPPTVPVLRAVRQTDGGFEVSWYPNLDEDLLGYRLYYSYDNLSWRSVDDETSLGAASTSKDFDATVGNPLYFRLTAVDTSVLKNESVPSDVYGMYQSAQRPRCLIVDGFDRAGDSGSWMQPSHFFAFTHGEALAANDAYFDTCPNDALLDGTVQLGDYEEVFWLLGDESTANETFDSQEQALVKTYLQNGGYLFVSGSEIAWDLDQGNSSSGSTPADEGFLNNFLKADYAGDDSEIYTAAGVAGGLFDGISFEYGASPYSEDWPDYITPTGGGATCLKYGATSKVAGVQFEGYFPNGTAPGKLVYLAFPFETITYVQDRFEVMRRVLQFFFPGTSVELAEVQVSLPRHSRLLGNYPNPFNPSTLIRYELADGGPTTVSIFNSSGQRVKTLLSGKSAAGEHSVVWDGRNDAEHPVTSGVYFCRLRTGRVVDTIPILLMR